MTTQSLTIDSNDVIRGIAAKAVFDAVGSEQRDLLIMRSIEHLITPPKKRSYYDPEPKTPLQAMFDEAIETASQKVVAELVDSDEARAIIKEVVGEHVQAFLKDKHAFRAGIASAVQAAVEKSFSD